MLLVLFIGYIPGTEGFQIPLIADCAKRTIMLKDGQIVNDPHHGTEAKGA